MFAYKHDLKSRTDMRACPFLALWIMVAVFHTVHIVIGLCDIGTI